MNDFFKDLGPLSKLIIALSVIGCVRAVIDIPSGHSYRRGFRDGYNARTNGTEALDEVEQPAGIHIELKKGEKEHEQKEN